MITQSISTYRHELPIKYSVDFYTNKMILKTHGSIATLIFIDQQFVHLDSMMPA
jgi:hypothetical protein